MKETKTISPPNNN